MKKNSKYNSVKKNISSIHVLKTLKVLLNGEHTMSELVQKLNENEEEPIFNNSVISKYINTCRACGIKIPKINNKYIISYIPFGLSFSDKESDIIQELQNYAETSLSVRNNATFQKLIQKLNMFSNKQIVQIEKGMAERACAEFEQAIKTQKKVKLILKTKKIIECVPIDILEKDGKLYFHVIYDKKEKNIASNRISGIEISQEKFADLKFDNTVIYKLTGDLAKNYNLRENERILNNNLPDSETIIIYNENIPMLISRLLRYGELCEIINPEKTRSKIKDIINETLANYGE